MIKNTKKIETQAKIKYGLAPHLMLDCYGCSPEKLADIGFVLNILEALPAKIGAKKIRPPQVFKYHGSHPQAWGVSGFVMVNKSHVSIHTFPDKEHAFVDIFSSEDFDADAIREELVSYFGATRDEVKVLHRVTND